MADEPTTDTTETTDTEDVTEDATTEDTATEDENTSEDTPNYAALIDDLTERLNNAVDQIEVLNQQVAALREENADLVESVVTTDEQVTDSHDATGDEFYDELFN